MRKVVLFVLMFFPWIIFGDAIKVEKILNTKSIKEYNQWVKKYKTDYPLLEPFLIDIKGLTAFHYNQNGRLVNEESFTTKEGWGMHIHTAPYIGIVVTVEYDLSQDETSPALYTIFQNGKQLFSFSWSFDYQTHAGVRFLPMSLGIFRSKPYNQDPNNCFAELIAWDGIYIGRIDSLCTINTGSRATADGKYLILNSDYIACLVKDGIELWRKNFNSAIETSISCDGQYVCIGDSGAVYVYNQQGSELYSYVFSPQGRENPYSSFSANNQYLAVATSFDLVLIDNVTGNVVWKKSVEGDNFKRHLYFVNDYIILTHTSSAKIYVYDVQGDLQTTINEPSLYCNVINDLIVINPQKNKFHKLIYRIK